MAIAKNTKNTKKNTKKVNTEWYENSVNDVSLKGAAKRIFVDTDNVLKFTLETVKKTPNDKFSHQFISIVVFKESFEDIEINEGDWIEVEGYINVSSYNNKYTTEVIAEEISVN